MIALIARIVKFRASSMNRYNNYIEPHLVTDMAFCKDWGGKEIIKIAAFCAYLMHRKLLFYFLM